MRLSEAEQRLVSPETLAHIMAVIDTNAARVNFTLRDGSQVQGTSLLPMVGLCQHSCLPNAALVALPDKNQFQLRITAVPSSASTLPAGEPIRIAYQRLHYTPTIRRRADLFHRYGFWCRCDLCVGPDRTRPFLFKGQCREVCLVCPGLGEGQTDEMEWKCERCGSECSPDFLEEIQAAEAELQRDRSETPPKDSSEGLLARVVAAFVQKFSLSAEDPSLAFLGNSGCVPGHPLVHERHHLLFSLLESAAPILRRRAEGVCVCVCFLLRMTVSLCHSSSQGCVFFSSDSCRRSHRRDERRITPTPSRGQIFGARVFECRSLSLSEPGPSASGFPLPQARSPLGGPGFRLRAAAHQDRISRKSTGIRNSVDTPRPLSGAFQRAEAAESVRSQLKKKASILFIRKRSGNK